VLRRRKTMTSVQVVRQCRECEALAGQVSAREVRELEREAIERMPWARQRRRRQPTARKRAMAAHLRSPEMRALRKRVFERDNGICRICGEPATDLYHLNTDSYGRETEKDVVASCAECNAAERQQRITRAVLGPISSNPRSPS